LETIHARMRALVCTKLSGAVSLIFLLVVFLVNTAIGADYYSIADGAWESPSSWVTDACGGTATASSIPQAGDNVFICTAILLNTTANINNLTVNSGGNLSFAATLPVALSVTGNVTVNTGGTFQVETGTEKHTLNLSGAFINNGAVNFWKSATSNVSLNFIGNTGSVVSGSGTWNLFAVTMNKASRPLVFEVQAPAFFSNFNSGVWTLTQGTYFHNCNATFNMASATTDYTINANTIVRVGNGTLNIAATGNELVLEGGLEITGGTVNVGRTNGTSPNSLRYRQSGGSIPFITISGTGLLNSYQGINTIVSAANTPFRFEMSGGTVTINTGTNRASWESFRVADNSGSVFNMSGGAIIIYRKTSDAARSDFAVCGGNGTVTSTGGKIQFGTTSSVAETYTFTPYPNATLPNIEVGGGAGVNITLRPFSLGNFRFLSLYIGAGKNFDISSSSDVNDTRTMTLTGQNGDGYVFYDNNNDNTDHFIYRMGTVNITSSGKIKTNVQPNLTTRRFHNLTIAAANQTIELDNDFGVGNILTVSGGVLNAPNRNIYLYYSDPLSITNGSAINLANLIFRGSGQNLPGYNYNCSIIADGPNTQLKQMGKVTCIDLTIASSGVTSFTKQGGIDTLRVKNNFNVGCAGCGGTSNADLSGVVVVEGDFNLNTNGYVNTGSSTIIRVAKDWNNTSTNATAFNENQSTVVFTGSGKNRIIYTSGTETFYNLEINKDGVDSLMTSVQVSNKLTLTNGYFKSSSTNKMIIGASATVSGGSNASFVDGPVQKINTGTFVFPLGKGGIYKPLGLRATTAGSHFTAEYFNVPAPQPTYNFDSKGAGVLEVSRCEYWSVNRDGGTNGARVKLSYTSESCGAAEYESYKVVNWRLGEWTDLGRGGSGTAGDANAGFVENTTELSSFGIFTLQGCPKPVVTASGPTTFCAGGSVTLTSEKETTNVWSPGGETTQSISVTTSGTYKVTAVTAGCTATSEPITVTVNPLPSLPSSVSVSPNPICDSAIVTMTASGATDYRWYEDDVTTTALGGGATYTTPSKVKANSQFYVTSYDENGCESATRKLVSISITNAPVPPVVKDTFLCAPGEIILTADGSVGGYLWYDTETGETPVGYGSNLIISNLTETRTYYATASASGCESSRESVTVNLHTPPSSPVGIPDSICGGGSVTLKASGSSGGYKWYKTLGPGPVEGTSNSYTTDSLSVTTTFYVSAISAEGCESESKTSVLAIVKKIPEMPEAVDGTHCGPGVVNLSVTGVTGSYKWFKDGVDLDVLASGDTYSPNVNSTTTFFVHSDSLGCYSSRIPVVATIFAQPSLPTGDDVPRCGPGRVTLEVSATAVSYKWYADSTTTTVLGTLPTYLTDSILNTTSYFVSSISAEGCESDGRTKVNAVINELPSLPVVTGGFNCGPGKVDLMASGSADNFIWYSEEVNGDSLSTGTTYTTESLLTTTHFYVLAKDNNGCISAGRSKVTATIKAIPDAPILKDSSRCGPGDVVLSAQGSSENKYKWYASAIGGTALDSADTFIAKDLISTQTFYVSSQEDGCQSARAEVVAVIHEIPSKPTATGDTVCGGGKLNLQASGAVDYYWYENASLGAKLDSGSTFETPDLLATKSYYVSAISTEGCESTDRTEVVALVLDHPDEPLADDKSHCGPGALKLTASAGTGTFKWYSANDEELGDQAEFETGIIASDSVFYVTSIVHGCESTKKEVHVTIYPLPSSPVINDTSRCGPGTVELIPSGSPDIYRWYANESDDTSMALLVGATYSPTVTSTVSYYVSSVDAKQCESSGKTKVTVEVIKIPEAPGPESFSRCGPGEIELSASSPSQSYIWYTSSDVLLQKGSTYKAENVTSDTLFYVASDSAGCVSPKALVQAFVKPFPDAPVVSDTATCVAGSMTLSASGSPEGYVWYDEDDNVLHTGQTYITNSISQTTTFYISSSLDGCESNKIPLTVTLNSIPPTPQTQVVPVCGKGRVELSAGGSVGNYFWYTDEVSETPVENNATYLTDTLTASRVFYVLAEKDNCKSARVEVEAIVHPLPGAPGAIADSVCNEGDLQLRASGNFANYIWYSSLTGEDTLDFGEVLTVVNLTSTTTYYVSSIDDKGCTSEVRTPVQAIVHPSPAKPAVTGDERCGEGPVVLRASGADAYEWYEMGSTTPFPTTADSLEVISLTETKTYYVKSVRLGCVSIDSSEVVAKINPIPAKPDGVDGSVCGSGSVLLSALNSPDKYLWYEAAESDTPIDTTLSDYQTPVLSANKTYYVSALDLLGCESEKEAVTAFVKPLPDAPVTIPDSICGSEGTMTLKATGTAETFKWYASATGSDFLYEGPEFIVNDLPVTTDYYVASELAGCSSAVRSVVSAIVKDLPNQPVTVNDTICGGGNVTLRAIAAGAESFIWYNGETILENEENDSLKISVTNTTVFSVSSYYKGCKSSAKTEVWAVVKPLPTPPVPENGFSCGPGSVTLRAYGGGNKIIWYKSSVGGSPAGEGETIVTSSLTSDTAYYVTSVAQECENTTRIPVVASIKPRPANPVAEDKKLCGAQKVTLVATGAPANGEYLWYEQLSGNVKNSGATYEIDADTTMTLYVSVSQDGCKSDLIPVTVEVDTIPANPITSDVTRCGAGDVTLQASGSTGQYNWYTSKTKVDWIGTGNELELGHQASSASFYVSSFDENCESETVEVKVTINPESNAGMLEASETLLCKGENSGVIKAVGVEGAVKAWLVSGNNFLTAPEEVSGGNELEYTNISASTGYKVVVQNGDCPADTSDALVLAVDNAPMTVGGTLLLEDSTSSGGVLKLADYVGSIVRWEYSSDGSDYQPMLNTDTEYQFSVRAMENYYRVVVKSGICPERPSEPYFLGEFLKLKIYTSFSPNGDGINDTWFIDGIEAFPDNKVSIFNRWGNLVFEASGYDNHTTVWKGTANTGMLIGKDNELPDGTYFYNLDWGKGKKPSTGYVVIKR